MALREFHEHRAAAVDHAARGHLDARAFEEVEVSNPTDQIAELRRRSTQADLRGYGWRVVLTDALTLAEELAQRLAETESRLSFIRGE